MSSSVGGADEALDAGLVDRATQALVEFDRRLPAEQVTGAADVGAALQIGEKVTKKELPPMTPAEIEAAGAKAAEAKVANDQIKSGEALGSFSFTAAGE